MSYVSHVSIVVVPVAFVPVLPPAPRETARRPGRSYLFLLALITAVSGPLAVTSFADDHTALPALVVLTALTSAVTVMLAWLRPA